MAFPTTDFLDIASRANETPLSNGGKWTGPWFSGDGTTKIVNDLILLNTGTFGEAYWNATNFGPDTEFGFMFSAVAATDVAYIDARLNGEGGSSPNAYEVQYNNAGVSGQWAIAKYTSGTPATLGATFSQTISPGDSWGISVTGGATTTIKAWYRPGQGAWTQLASRDDSTSPITTAGKVAFGIKNGTHQISNIFGGTVTAGLPTPPSFPTTPIIDNTTRADENPLGNGNWTEPEIGGDGTLQIISNKIGRGTTGYGDAYWSSQTFGPDVEMYYTISTVDNTGSAGAQTLAPIWLDARINSPGNKPGITGYGIAYNDVGNAVLFNANFRIYKYKSADVPETQLIVLPPLTLANGDSFGMSIIGNTIYGWAKQGAGAWFCLGSVTDTDYTGTTGRIALGMKNNTTRLSAVGGGTALPTFVPAFVQSNISIPWYYKNV